MGDKDAGNDFCIWLKDGANDVQTSSTKKSGKVHEVGEKWLTQNFEVEKCILRQSCSVGNFWFAGFLCVLLQQGWEKEG